ncbi:hypothetical protein ACFX2I_043158 [Malus domestica]
MELSPPAFTKLATTHVALPFGSPSLHPPTTDKIAPLSGRPISTIQSTVNVPSSPSSKLGISTDAGKSRVWATTTTSLSPAHLTLHSSGNLGFEISSAYWPDPSRVSWDNVRSTYNNTRTAMLDSLGSFVSSDNSTFESTDYGVRLQRRLRIDIDGNVRLYSRERAGEKWVVSREAISDTCTVHRICGANRVQLRTVLVGNAHGWFQACCLLVVFFPSCLLVFST